MAKKKKNGRKKAAPEAEPKTGPKFWAGVGAIALIIGGIIVLFGAFIEAPIPKGMWDGVWWAFGAASWLAPLALIYLGVLKLASEEQRIPLPKLTGTVGTVLLLAAWLHVIFVSKDAFGSESGGYGGEAGNLLGGVLMGALGKFLSGLILLVLSVVAVLFTLNVPPKRLLELFKRQPKEGEEDLSRLKSRLQDGFKLNAGVPIERQGSAEAARVAAARAASQKLAPAEAQAALTAASDPDWQFPPLSLLSQKQDKADAGDVQGNADIIKDTFAQFNYEVEVDGANIGPRVTQYTLTPPAGVKLDRLTALEKNLSLNLAAHSLRMEAPIPGTRSVGVEVPNRKSATVTLHSVISSPQWHEVRSPLAFAVGKDIAGTPVVADLDDMPHLLIAGQTKAGKSVMINALLASFLYRNSPSDLKLILVDPKYVEMAPYHDIPHLIAPVITEPEKCISALKWAVAEMERRLKTFSEFKQRDIQGYNRLKKEEGMPHIVIIIDELSDLMMVAPRDVEALIARVAQKARAAGIHLVLATQRPEAKVVTGLIKANVPASIAFAVKDQINSRIIIDSMGAEKLLGRGDMLFKTPDLSRPVRIQGALITGEETNRLCDFLREQRPPNYNDEVMSQPVQLNGRGGVVASAGDEVDDDAWRDAVRVVIDSRKASTSLLQRKLGIGYGRAAKLMDQMEEQGIISPASGNKPREVLVSSLEDVFAAPAAAEGDVYGDMPEQPEDPYADR